MVSFTLELCLEHEKPHAQVCLHWSSSCIVVTISLTSFSLSPSPSFPSPFPSSFLSVQAGLPIHAPSFYGTITLDQLNEVFRSETNVSIPLLERRRENLHEVAAVLTKVRSLPDFFEESWSQIEKGKATRHSLIPRPHQTSPTLFLS